MEEFLKEAVIMRSFNHENVMSLIGVSAPEGKPQIILPFCAHGDLLGFLKRSRLNKVTLTLFFRSVPLIILPFCAHGDLLGFLKRSRLNKVTKYTLEFCMGSGT